MASGEGYIISPSEALGTPQDLDRIAALEVPQEVRDLAGLRDFLSEHRVVESFAAAIREKPTVKAPERGYFALTRGDDFTAVLQSGTYGNSGPNLSVSKYYRGDTDGDLSGSYDLAIPIATTVDSGVVVNAEPSVWVAERWALGSGNITRTCFDPESTDKLENNPQLVVFLVKQAAQDLAAAIRQPG